MRFLLKLYRLPAVATLIISGLSFFVIIGIRGSGAIEYLELAAYDWFMRLRPEVSNVSPRIVLIEISEKDILEQQRWPLTDSTVARILTIVSRYKPRAIGLDIFRDIPVPPGTEELNAALSGSRNVIAVMKFGNGGVPPPPALDKTNQVGFNDIVVDPGGIVRKGLLFLDNGKTAYYSFDLLLALLYLHKEGLTARPDDSNPQYLRLGHSTIYPFETSDGGYVRADARGYQYFLDFRDAWNSFPSYSLKNLLSGEVDPESVRDKIVLLGVAAQSVKDLFYTPYSRGIRAESQIPGILLHAHIISQLIRFGMGESSPLRATSQNQEILWILFWSLIGGGMGFFTRSPWLFSISGAGGLLVLWLTSYMAFLKGFWIPSVPPAMTWLISAAVVTAYISNREKKERATLMQLFSRHVSPEVAESIWERRDQFLQGARPRSQKMVVTVLFSDFKGFTSISESMDPESLIDWLNTYMESMADLVMKHGGVVDDYAGDGIKANFGVPVPRETEAEIEQDAVRAVTCAIAMGKEMERLNAQWSKKGLPTGGTRIGIYTGPVVAGVLGSLKRLKYTTVGDTVNIAARLESYDKDLAKASPWRILIGESTLHYLDNRFTTQRVTEASLKGKNRKITIHRIFSEQYPKPDIKGEEVET